MELSLGGRDMAGASGKRSGATGRSWRCRMLGWLPGGVMMLVGGSIAATAWGYDLGSIDNMGPGFFPFVLGLVLVGLGVAELFSASGKAEVSSERPPVNWRAICCISSSLLAFALLINSAGLLPAIFIGVYLAMLSERPVRWISALLYSSALTAFGYVVFILGLGLPVSAVWW